MFKKETGLMGRYKDKQFIKCRMDQHMKENGKTISNTDKAKKPWQMEMFMRELTSTE